MSVFIQTDCRLLAGDRMATDVTECVKEIYCYLFVWNTQCSFMETSLNNLGEKGFCNFVSAIQEFTQQQFVLHQTYYVPFQSSPW